MKKIYGFAIASAALMLASCASDVANEPAQPEGAAAGYLKISLEGLTDGTRADDEVTISNINFHFEKGTTQKQDINVNGTTGDNKFISADKKTVVVKLGFIPDKVRAVVNGTENSVLNASNGVPTEACLKTLSSACYVGTGEWTAVPSNTIYTDADEAAKSDAKSVKINVDRSYARVDMAIADNAIDMSDVKYSNGTSEITVEFVPEYIFVNGVAQSADLFKSLPTLPATVQSTTANNLTEALVKNGDGSTRWAAGQAANWSWRTGDNLPSGKSSTHHYAIGSVPGGKLAQNVTTASQKVYENTPSTGSVTKDFTHVVVAGTYKLTGITTETDGTFYTFSATADGKPIVYGTKKAVIAAMAGSDAANADLKEVKDSRTDKRTTANYVLTIGGVEQENLKCSKYDKGMVYYAAAISNKLSDAVTLNGIVRNHIYNVTISKIAGFGTPIQDTTEEIIPEPEIKDEGNYYMQLNIVVNPMVTVNNEIEWK